MTEDRDNYETFMRLLIVEQSAVKAYVRRLVPAWHDVEEVVQQASLTAWKKFDELDDVNRFGGWLMTIARFEALKYRRSLARSPLVFSDKLVEVLADTPNGIVAAEASRKEAFESCLGKLGDAQRKLLLNVHKPGVTVRAYAHQTKRPEASLYKAVHRLRQKLHACIQSTLALEGNV